MLEPAEPELMRVALDRIVPSPTNPRKTFEQEPLEQLAKSIREKGVLEPIIVRPRKWAEVTQFKELQAPTSTIKRLDNLLDADLSLRGVATVEDLISRLDQVGGARTLALHKIGLTMPQATEVSEALYMFEQHTKEKLGYELIAGERRWRASKLAGMKIIPAIVRDLDDKAAAEVAVIENDQREDVPPLEQAEGYARLVQLGDDAEAIAVKIGRPVKYVAGRLQLTHLVDELKDDVRTGKLPFGHAWLLSRLQPVDQRELRKYVFVEYGQDRGQPVPVAQLRNRIRSTRVHELSAAPWKWDDAELLPAAGPCTTCPKRSGNNRTLFDDLLNGEAKKGQEFCTDGTCYRAKRDAFVELQVKRVAEKNGGEALRVSTSYAQTAPGVLSADRFEVLDKKAAKAAPPDQVKQAVIVDGYSDEEDRIGRVVQVRLKADKPAARSSGDDSFRREQKKREERVKLYRAAAVKANALVADKVRTVVGSPDGGSTAVQMLRQLAAALTGCGGADACRAVVKRRGLEKVKAAYGGMDATRGPVRRLALDLDSAGELLGLVAEVLAAHESEKWCFAYSTGAMSAEDKAFWAAFGVDRAKLLKEVEAETKGPGVQAKRDKVKAKRDRNKKLAAVTAPKKGKVTA